MDTFDKSSYVKNKLEYYRNYKEYTKIIIINTK